MSVVSVEPISSRSGGIGDDYARTYVIVYRVITNAPLDGPLVARLAVPYKRGDQYVFGSEYDTGSNCLTVVADEDPQGAGKVWVVTCSFGPAPQLEENPLQQPWTVSLSGQQVELPFAIDCEGRKVCNSVGDPFSTELMKQSSQSILSITRNEASFNPLLSLFTDTVNADPFFGARPGTVLFMAPKHDRQISATYGYYWPTTYEFCFNPSGWDKRVLNLGYRARNARGVMKNILVQGVPISEPALLTESGDILPQGAPPVVLTFKPYNRMPFSALGLE